MPAIVATTTYPFPSEAVPEHARSRDECSAGIDLPRTRAEAAREANAIATAMSVGRASKYSVAAHG
jgi:hypothetical protein